MIKINPRRLRFMRTLFMTIIESRLKIISPVLLAFGIQWASCNMINPAEKVPTLIRIDSVSVKSTNLPVHGSVSHKITDVWVYHNLQLLGAFEVPCTIPVLMDKSSEIQIQAGIWENGLSAFRARYPFYTVETFNLPLNPGQTTVYHPQFSYRTGDSSSTVYFVEDFEQGNSFEKYNADTTLVKTNNAAEIFEGNWSAKMSLSDSDRTGQSITVQEFALPNNKNCYIELNYKSDVSFVLQTLIDYNGAKIPVDISGLKPSQNWNKAYFNFGPFVGRFLNTKFRFIVKAVLPEGQTNGNVWLDNFKIIRFN